MSGSSDKTVKVWNAATGDIEQTLKGHTNTVTSVALFGTSIVSGSWDRTVKLWVDSRKLQRDAASQVFREADRFADVRDIHRPNFPTDNESRFIREAAFRLPADLRPTIMDFVGPGTQKKPDEYSDFDYDEFLKLGKGGGRKTKKRSKLSKRKTKNKRRKLTRKYSRKYKK